MPVFETPQAISVTLDLLVGTTRLDAGARTDTVVEVRPSDPNSEADAKVAEHTRVEYASGRLLVKGPKQRVPFGTAGSVDVTVELPADSDVRAVAQTAAFQGSGRLGECRIKTSTGDIQLQETGPLTAMTSIGDVTVDRVDGRAEITVGSGAVRLGTVTGPAVVKNSNGETSIGEVTGGLRIKAANGGISVGKAHGAVEAKTANGDIRIDEAIRGSIVLGTSIGQLSVGIAQDTAALLDIRTKSGVIHNFLKETDGPGEAAETMAVYATTSSGDISICRADP